MSLRIFHIVFITLSTLLALFVAGWEVQNYRAFGGWHFLGAAIAVACAITLLIYGVWFWKKARRLIL